MRDSYAEAAIDQSGIFLQPDFANLDHQFEELYGQAFAEFEGSSPDQPWLLVEDSFPELHRAAQEARIRFLGGIAIRGESGVIPEPTAPNVSTCLAAVQEARLGGDGAGAARRVIENNAATDLAERMFKVANKTVVHLKMSDGKIRQEQRALTDLHRNALEHTVLIDEMLRRTSLELTNALLFEYLHGAGLLNAYNALVISPSSTVMTTRQKKQYNMFLDTETCSMQMLSADGDELTLETALVAGKKTADSPRHDLETIRKMAADHGLEIRADDGTDVLRHVMLVPKSTVAGVEGIVRWYDDAAGGTFYGQDKPRQDYAQHARECQERSDNFAGIVATITDQLIAEAHTFKTPMDVMLRLDELSEQHSVEYAVHDGTIDEAVFGEEAARHIQDARFFLEIGQMDRFEDSMSKAQDTAISGSCPLSKDKGSDGDSSDPDGKNGDEVIEEKWMSCPYCGAKVKDDPCAKRLACPDCTALVVEGEVLSTGNGGSAARRRAAEQMLSEIFGDGMFSTANARKKKEPKHKALAGVS